MSLTPALTGVVGTLPLPNTAPTPASGETVKAADVQDAVQALLNQDATLQAYVNDGAKTINPGTVNAGKVIDGLNVPGTHAYASTVTLNLALSVNHEIAAMTGNMTIAMSNFPIGRLATVRVVQDGTGSRTVTWPVGIFFAQHDPQPKTTALNATYYAFMKASDGAIWCLARTANP